jgi:hypothetical protein
VKPLPTLLKTAETLTIDTDTGEVALDEKPTGLYLGWAACLAIEVVQRSAGTLQVLIVRASHLVQGVFR